MVSIKAWVLPKSRREQAPHFSKAQIATVLEQVATLLKLKDANPFRIRAYENGSRTIASLEQDLWELSQSGTMTDVKGIGKGIASLIGEALGEGTWGDLQKLYDDTPQGMIEMLAIPGLGPKRIKQLHDELSIDSIADLSAACNEGAVEPLDRFGAKSQQKILDGIDLLARFQGRRRLNVGLLYGEAFEAMVAKIDGVEHAQLAGSARRRRETIGDLDIVAAVKPDDVEAVTNAILAMPDIAEVKGAGDSKVSVILEASILERDMDLGTLDSGVFQAIGGDDYSGMESSGTIEAQVRMVPPHVFAFTLAYFTGSKEHNIHMRQLAIDNGLRLNEFGLIPEIKAGDLTGLEAAQYSLPAKNEEDIYHHLGLDWVPPELREDMGEVDAAKAKSLPRLVMPTDLKGSFHNHTTLSDGVATLEQMAAAAMDMDWQFLGIADHSQMLNIGGRQIGADAEDLLQQGEKIRGLNEVWADGGKNFRLLHGAECDILSDGSLDYDEETRMQLNHVVASVHQLPTWRARDEVENSEALIKAIEDPTCTILGHPTGRILQGRDGFDVDMHAVLRRMGELNAEGELKSIEINASPYRLDLDWRFVRYARDQGVPVCINPDAHDTAGLRDVWFGVQMARKGWLEPKDLLNCYTGEEIEALLS
ncbi:MAG: DNA polymerase/3'-5' exonuclease PolX [Euryarchaeota archaeon]|nr:DNA polymerase/3'-5' exonuclease PolX [Euryarchaeota archaeon]